MESKLENIVMCCFCGGSIKFNNALQISILVDNDLNEYQTVYSHKQCLDEVLHKDVVRHPDVMGSNDKSTLA